MNKKMIIATSVVLISTLNSVSGFADENSSDSIPTSETGDTLPLLDGTVLTKDTEKCYDIEGSLYTDERIEQLQEAFIKAHTPPLPEVEVPTPKAIEQQVPELPEVEVPTPKAIEQKVPSLSKVEVKAPKPGKPEGDNSKKEREKNAPVAIAKSKNDPDRSIKLRKLTNNKKDSLDGIQSKFREVKKVHVPIVVEGNKAISNGNIKTAPFLSKLSQRDSTSLPQTGFSKLEERTSLFVTLLGFLTSVVSVYLFLLPKVKRNGK